MIYLSVALGGAIGALLRFLLSRLNVISNFPYGTFFANVLGSFLIGFFYFYFAQSELSSSLKVFMTSGFIGALTTYSTLNLELFLFLQEENYSLFFLYFFLNACVGIICVFTAKKLLDLFL